jgi:ribosomal protein S6--L-glutamate ligase
MVHINKRNKILVTDKDGPIVIDCLAPYLLFGFPNAINALRILSHNAFTQNSIDSVMIADDKAATAERLAFSNISQVATIICSTDINSVLTAAVQMSYPVVLKRTHGAQGRWVRLATDEKSLRNAYEELIREGTSALLIQPQIKEAKGRSIRAIMTGGQLLAVTERIAKGDEWRSNISNGSIQRKIDLDKKEQQMVIDATKALGLSHAGVDLLTTATGSVVLEVNSSPDFTSMIPYFDHNIAEAVLKASLSQTKMENKQGNVIR